MTPQEFIDYTVDTFGPAKMLLSLVPEEKLDWRPHENMRTVRELIHHLSARTGVIAIVTGELGYGGRVRRHRRSQDHYIAKRCRAAG